MKNLNYVKDLILIYKNLLIPEKKAKTIYKMRKNNKK